MKKTVVLLLAILLLASLQVCAYADWDPDNAYEIPLPEVGLTLQLPEEILIGGEAGGLVELLTAEEVGYHSGVYFTQLIYEPDGEVFDADNYAPYLTFLCTREGYDEKVANDPELIGLISSQNIYEVGTVGAYTHYAAIGTDRLPDGFSEANVDEYMYFLSMAEDIVQNAGYGEPEDPYAETVGNAVSFETTDLEGNSISSAELFARNEITMLNIWETGCGACKGELAELAEINERLRSIDCGIVGLLWDSDSPECVDEARRLLAEAGGSYTTICSPSNFEDLFPISGFPTSFFIDRDGHIVGSPVVGAQVDKYEEAVREILSGDAAADMTSGGNTAGKNPFAAKAGVMEVSGKAAPAKSGGYQVICVDEDGRPVQGAMIQFCSDEMCRMGKTDKDGIAVFDGAPGHYVVHLLRAPAGFAPDDTEYEAPEPGGDITITLKAA